jgi:hypothetical protein
MTATNWCLRMRSIFVLLMVLLTGAAQASLVLSPSSTRLSISAGEYVVVSGRITNTTGANLLTTDLFISISGFPFDAIEVTPLLGIPELSLVDRSISPELDLFSLQAADDFIGTLQFDFSVFVEDINGVFSEPVAILVTLDGANANGVPEPTSAALALSALLCLLATGRRARLRRQNKNRLGTMS